MIERRHSDLPADDDAEVRAYMSALASTSVAEAPLLPDAENVWVRAQLVRRWAAEREAERPLQTMQSLHIGLAVAAALTLFVRALPLLRSLFTS